MGTVDLARRVVERHQHEGGLDVTTASAIIAVADALSDANREKLNALPLNRAVDIVWKLISKDIS